MPIKTMAIKEMSEYQHTYCSGCNSRYNDGHNSTGHNSTRELEIRIDGRYICPTCKTDAFLKDIYDDGSKDDE